MSSTTLTAPGTGYTTKQKVGIVVAGLYGLTNIPSMLFPTGTDDADGPPHGDPRRLLDPRTRSRWSPRCWRGAATESPCGSPPAPSSS